MYERLEVVRRISNNKYLVKDFLGKTQILNTERVIKSGQQVLVSNGVFLKVVQTVVPDIVQV